jgi:MFS family permease
VPAHTLVYQSTGARSPAWHERLILLLLGAVTVTYTLAQTLMIPAIPYFAGDLHTSITWATWVATGFLLVSAVAMPIVGKIGDQFGRAKVLKIVLVIFLAGTAGAAVAWSIGSLVAFRAVQGVAGALFPLSFGIIRDEFRPERVGHGIGVISGLFGVGSGLGLVLSGVILDHLSWRFLFVLPAVVLACTTLLVFRLIPASPLRERTRIDVPGAALLAFTLVTLLVGISLGPHVGFSSPIVVGLFSMSSVGATAWVLVESQQSAPLVDVRLLAQRSLLPVSAIATLSSAANFLTLLLVATLAESPRHVPPRLQHLVHYGLGASGLRTGLLLLPLSMSMLVAGPVAARLARRVPVAWVLLGGMITLSVLTAAIAVWHRTTVQFVTVTALQGVAFGFVYTSLITLTVESVPASETAAVTGLVTTLRTVGTQIGAQVSAAILAAIVIGETSIPSEQAFTVAFAAAAAVALVGAILAGSLCRRKAYAWRAASAGGEAISDSGP